MEASAAVGEGDGEWQQGEAENTAVVAVAKWCPAEALPAGADFARKVG